MRDHNEISDESFTKAKKLLVRLGFPSHTADLYIYILCHCPVPTHLVCRIIERRENLQWLLKNGYVYEETDEVGNRYYTAINPYILSKALFDGFIWSRLRFHIVSKEDMECLSPKDKTELHDFRKMCDDLAEILSRKSTKSMTEGLMYLKGKEQLAAVLSDCIMNTSREIFGVVVPKWTPSLPVIWESLKHKIYEGVRYKRISDELTFVAFGYLINKRDVDEIGVKLRVLERPKIREKFYILDDKVAIVFWPGLPTDFGFEATYIDNKSLVKIFLEKAKKMWSSGIPAEEALNFVGKLRCDFLKACREDPLARMVAKEVFDYGIFSKFKGVPVGDQDVLKILRDLEKNGLVTKVKSEYYPYGQTGYIPNITDDILAFIRSRTESKKW